MKNYKSFLLLFWGVLLVLAFAPLSVNAAESNGSSIADWDYTSNTDGSITLTKYKGTSKDIVVPGKLDGKQVKIKSFKDTGISSGDNLVVGTPGEKVIYDSDSLSSAFEGSTYRSIDLSGLDTSKVVSMASMFELCRNLTKVDVSDLDTSKVVSMASMFKYCMNLTEVDVSDLDTSKLAVTVEMFQNCSSLKEIDVSNFDLPSVNEHTFYNGTHGMFMHCDSLQYVNLGNLLIMNREHAAGFDGPYCNMGLALSPQVGKDVPSVVILHNERAIGELSSNGKSDGKTLFGNPDVAFKRVAYTADVKLDANGGTFKEKVAGNEKTITLGDRVIYDTVDSYKNEFTVTTGKLADKTENPTKNGDKFNGWYLDKECTKPLETLDMTLGHDSEVTLYAGYGEKKAEIDKPADKPETDKPTGDKNNSTANPVQKMTKAVQTGDFSSPYFWAFVALIAMIGAAVTVIVRRKSVRTN